MRQIVRLSVMINLRLLKIGNKIPNGLLWYFVSSEMTVQFDVQKKMNKCLNLRAIHKFIIIFRKLKLLEIRYNANS